MKLCKLRIRNLRSIKDTGEFPITSMFGLVGENNTGKSTILKAIEVVLSAGAARLTPEDLNSDAEPIIITAAFDGLSATDKVRWRPYLVEDQLILEKQLTLVIDDRTGKEKLEAEFHGYKAEPKEWFLSMSKIQERHGDRPKWADIVGEAGLPDYFLEGGKATKSSYVKALSRYLLENEVAFDAPDLSHTQALGLQSNVIAALPRVYLLPAITDYSDEVDRRSSNSTFRRLMGTLSERILEKDPRFAELQEALSKIRALLNRSTLQDAPPRITSLKQVEDRIGEILSRVMPSVKGVALSVEVDDIKDLFAAGVALSVDDGINTDVLAKGHGLQRCVVFSLLQTLILNERNQLIPQEAEAALLPDPIILLVEEPELYLHPQLSKIFSDVLSVFSETDQAVYTTHSPWFVDAYQSERVAIVSKPSLDVGTKVRSCNRSAFNGLTERKIFQGFTRLNPAMNELFFATRVLLVEGPEDLVAVTSILQRAGIVRVRAEELGWSILVCGGKPSIPFFQRVLNAFTIPYAVMHDLDEAEGMNENDKATNKLRNDAITELAGVNPIYTFPVRLEHSLGVKQHFKEQYDAHAYFSTVDVIPEDVQKLVLKIFS
ncbi:ATP-dependent nuclease [Burkholderia pyrrocinia]|uniref:ATP-dependent nuclease n=1 Tax=Burkholderia pyrrocinia TaxID=60550 RepID=UPI001BCFAFBC|nr:AAA family ATPase [Burkholderia pyrrocinia]QVN21011.1 ATP-dependent endonuclease [Burkholderia pyrrocinia]